MRLFDTDTLKDWVENWFTMNRYYHPYSKANNIPITELYDILERIPTVDAVERKRGRWIHGREIGREMIGDCITAIFYEDWKCSACGCTVEEERQPLWNFCPSCGAVMRKGEEE